MRTIITKDISDFINFEALLINWAAQFREIIFLNSNKFPQKYSSFDAVLAVDAFTAIKTDYTNAFQDLQQYQSQVKDWIFGYLSYDLKNDTEALTSTNFDGLEFPDLYFFQPKKLFFIRSNQLEISYLKMCDDEIESDFEQLISFKIPTDLAALEVEIQQRIDEKSYLEKLSIILEHIQKGACYEANFCMEFFAENVNIEPIHLYKKLNTLSEPPFSVYFKNDFHHVISASPERYLRKEQTKIISQPIKGTCKRSTDREEDTLLKNDLQTNAKERAENIMIVDLVRNDLSITATKGSVQVEELCEIYSFKQVHHLISTVVSEVEHTLSPVEIIRTTFPMGSMTGAPKIAAMKVIETLECTKRGVYSGAIGYFSPSNDFDFNVVIRSVFYNSKNKYLSFSVGSAITANAIPIQEYQECLLKAKAIFEVLSVK